MFVTEKLNTLSELIETRSFSEQLENILQQQYVNLEATLLRAKVLREFSKLKVHYIIQSEIQAEQASLAFLFSPFILANLNKAVIYNTAATLPVLNILNNYYQAEKNQNVKIDEVLNTLNIYLDLSFTELEESDFLYLSIIKALCRADVSSIFIITNLEINPKIREELETFFKVSIRLISTQHQENIIDSRELNTRKLFFKNKDADYIKLCGKFSEINSELLQYCDIYNTEQTINLIEDMFYSEHIYEKLSVYAEYMQTCLQHQNSVFSLRI
ncbi:hypothetical protein B9T25_12380 [Acinetobacter sp. ANC 4470]|uniref:hypothetical protein n=1 Tax=Acinetobacter sp. ANC 4470 TaxID=1977881 RepID=UPI000A34D092|nr:hypothetical protein [Acinetobacter sp. ANC 4470]OTG64873.1 hypothetical protein B9T25_12380 [Acinetobacter sp. ANC 4470]